MQSHSIEHGPPYDGSAEGDEDRERRLELLIQRLPTRIQAAVRWLRRPSKRWARVPAGILLVMGGVLNILPLLGIWMLPLGLVLLSDDVQLLRNKTGRILGWVEHHRPRWMGLPHAPQHPDSWPKETS